MNTLTRLFAAAVLFVVSGACAATQDLANYGRTGKYQAVSGAGGGVQGEGSFEDDGGGGADVDDDGDG